MERPRSIAHPEHQRAAGFASDDIGVGLALFLEDVLDQPRQTLRTLAEDAFGGADQIVLLVGRAIVGGDRSEEHTSELQSLMRISYAVFCLKKKKNENKKDKNKKIYDST